MNNYLLIAAILAFLLGCVHSILGEILIFRYLHKAIIVEGKQFLQVRQVRALWSTWHLLTLFGWGLAIVLFCLSQATPLNESHIGESMAWQFSLSAIHWVYGTRGKHPAWIVFLIIAGLTWYGLSQYLGVDFKNVIENHGEHF